MKKKTIEETIASVVPTLELGVQIIIGKEILKRNSYFKRLYNNLIKKETAEYNNDEEDDAKRYSASFTDEKTGIVMYAEWLIEVTEAEEQLIIKENEEFFTIDNLDYLTLHSNKD